MPEYAWKGVNLDGDICSGTRIARSHGDLEAQLFKHDIGLMHAVLIKPWSLFRPIPTSVVVDFFQQFAVLVNSGLYVDKALVVLKSQVKNEPFARIVADMVEHVGSGMPLAQTFLHYPELFDSVVVQLAVAGQESGRMAQVLAMIADYLQERHEFYKKLKHAALMPMITLFVFAIIFLGIVCIAVPMFATMFRGMGQELPYSTQLLLDLGTVLKSWLIIPYALFSVGIGWGLQKVSAKYCAGSMDWLILHIPFVGGMVLVTAVQYYLLAVGLLVQNGSNLLSALQTVQTSVVNRVIKNRLLLLQEHVEQGKPLASAMAERADLFSDDIVALVAVGQESGTMGRMLVQAATVCKKKIEKKIFVATTVAQPLLMIVLGALICGLIIMIYQPILQLSFMIN